MELNKGIIQGDSLAMYKFAQSLKAFREDNIGSEELHGAVQEGANEFKVEITDTYKSGKARMIQYYNNGNTPSVELLSTRMVYFPDIPFDYDANSISSEGVGLKLAAFRTGFYFNRIIPGEDGCVIKQEFKYFDKSGNEMDIEKNISKGEFKKNCKKIEWSINQTKEPNSNYFDDSTGFIVNNYIFEDSAVDIDILSMEENLKSTHKELMIQKGMDFIDPSVPRKKRLVKHRILNDVGELKTSYLEFNKTKPLKFKYDGKTFIFDVYWDFKTHKDHEHDEYKKSQQLLKGHIEYCKKGYRKDHPLLSILGPQHIILDKVQAGKWWSGFKYDRYANLEVFIKPKQDMRGYYNAVKTDGYSNEELEKTLFVEMRKHIVKQKEIISPHYDKAKKAEDSLGDQFHTKCMDKKKGRYLRQTYESICGTKSQNMIDLKKWKIRRNEGFYEADVIFNGDTNIWWELQPGTSDPKHRNGFFGRVSRGRDKYEYFFWTADKHTLYNDIEVLLSDINWRPTDKTKKVFLITNEQLLEGFEQDEIIEFDIQEIINKS